MPTEIVISKAGGPEVFKARHSSGESLPAGHVRVAVAAAGINFADVSGRIGIYPDAPAIPYCPGYEISGTVVEVGAGVAELSKGDRVCALTRFGGYADQVVLETQQAFPIPDGVDLVAAAGVPVTYLTARTCLFEIGGLRPGQSVLILGGAGGVGTAAIQLIRQIDGVKLIATAGSNNKCQWMKEHGVDYPVNYNEGSVAAAVAAATDDRGVDLVLDPIGGRGLLRSIAMCAPLGRVVMFGAIAANPGKRRQVTALIREGVPMRFFNLFKLLNANVGLHGCNMVRLAEARPELMATMMAAILADIAAGDLEPVIAKRFPLTAAGACAAHHYIQDRKNIGKLLLVKDL